MCSEEMTKKILFPNWDQIYIFFAALVKKFEALESIVNQN